MSVTVQKPKEIASIFLSFSREFPELNIYDVDIPLPLRFAAQTRVDVLGRCVVEFEGNQLIKISPLNDQCELAPEGKWLVAAERGSYFERHCQ